MKAPESRTAVFIDRPNRFLARCRVDDAIVSAHVPHSGRLTELLTPGAACRLVPVEATRHRKTAWDLLMVRHYKHWVCIDSRWANALVGEALAGGSLPAFSHRPLVEAEARVHGRRLDFRLSNGQDHCYVEVKCVTLVESGTALFPDAPTARGATHLEILMRLVREGHAASLVFVILRSDAEALLPHVRHDPAFTEALRKARRAGVGLQAWTTNVNPRSITLSRTIPVICPSEGSGAA